MILSPVLQDPAVRTWLGGIVPIWTMLEAKDFRALLFPPMPGKGPIRLATDLTGDEVRQSPAARTTLMLLRAAAEGPGLKMTAAGNLTRAEVSRLCECFEWPDFDRREFRRYYAKALNEEIVRPLWFVRHLAMEAALLRRYKGHMRATPTARRTLAKPDTRALQAMLFFTAFWRLDLGFFSRDAFDIWPQSEAGLVLWCLSIAAAEWRTDAELTRMCAVPDRTLLHPEHDFATSAMSARIVRPLVWFGLLEHRDQPPDSGRVVPRRVYRKTALFDRFLSFDIQSADSGATRH